MSASWRPIAATVCVTVVAAALMVVTDMGPALPLIAGLGALLGAVIWYTVDLEAEVDDSGVVPSRRVPTAVVRTDFRVSSLRSGLAFRGREDRTVRELHDTLVAVIDDELAAAHGVDRHTDPAAAGAILGTELWRFVTEPEPGRSLARPSQLDHILTLIERI